MHFRQATLSNNKHYPWLVCISHDVNTLIWWYRHWQTKVNIIQVLSASVMEYRKMASYIVKETLVMYYRIAFGMFTLLSRRWVWTDCIVHRKCTSLWNFRTGKVYWRASAKRHFSMKCSNIQDLHESIVACVHQFGKIYNVMCIPKATSTNYRLLHQGMHTLVVGCVQLLGDIDHGLHISVNRHQ